MSYEPCTGYLLPLFDKEVSKIFDIAKLLKKLKKSIRKTVNPTEYLRQIISYQWDWLTQLENQEKSDFQIIGDVLDTINATLSQTDCAYIVMLPEILSSDSSTDMLGNPLQPNTCYIEFEEEDLYIKQETSLCHYLSSLIDKRVTQSRWCEGD